MKVSIVPFDEFCSITAMDKSRPEDAADYESWEGRRKLLIEALSEQLRFRKYETTPGDFWVGDDWFEVKAFAVVLAKTSLVSLALVQRVRDFVATQEGKWLVEIGINMAMGRDNVKIGVLPSETYATIYDLKPSKIKGVLSPLLTNAELKV